MRKEHAEHNESLCDLLIEKTGFNDWVVTTAFYASIHYVEHKLFPLEKDGKNYTTFDHLYSEKTKGGDKISKHKLKIKLVNDHLRHVWSRYKRLHDVCHTARYKDYIVSDSVAKTAKIDLDTVKAACQ